MISLPSLAPTAHVKNHKPPNLHSSACVLLLQRKAVLEDGFASWWYCFLKAGPEVHRKDPNTILSFIYTAISKDVYFIACAEVSCLYTCRCTVCLQCLWRPEHSITLELDLQRAASHPVCPANQTPVICKNCRALNLYAISPAKCASFSALARGTAPTQL